VCLTTADPVPVRCGELIHPVAVRPLPALPLNRWQ
jgi:hypothetical protein